MVKLSLKSRIGRDFNVKIFIKIFVISLSRTLYGINSNWFSSIFKMVTL